MLNEEMSLQEAAMRLYQNQLSIDEALEWMKRHGQSVLLNWGEDDNLWECSWITGGDRFTGAQSVMRLAVIESINKAFAKAVQLNPTGENNGLRSGN